MPSSHVARYGQMRLLGEFEGLADGPHPRGQAVVVRTDRGTELAEVLCPATERTASLVPNGCRGAILRVASPEDVARQDGLRESQARAFETCRAFVDRRRLAMDLVDVEAILGGERIVFYYLAEHRVDFRELVKDLARTFHTRIEMRQIGVRDEAKLLADYGDCGKPVCCGTHLTTMPPVSMKMAKLQKSTLDPAKISGRCGRLKCCLRYEFDTYQENEQALPGVGARVETERGNGRVIAQELLNRKLVVEFDDHRRILIAADEVRGVAGNGRPAGDESRRGGP